MNKIVQRYFLVVFLGVFIGGCAGLPQDRVTSKEDSLVRICAQNNVKWQWDSISQVVTLKFGGSEARVLVGSEQVLVGEQRIQLSAPIKTVRSTIIVPPDFKRKVIDPLKSRTVIKPLAVTRVLREVIIDAGHGGKDPGASSPSGLQEKEVVLDIAKRLKKVLERKGIKVRMTRSKDEFISLQRRTEIASRSRADYFVSIHANSAPVRGLNGMEVFSSHNLDYSEKRESQRLDNQKLLFDYLYMKKNSKDLENIIADMLYTNKVAQSDDMAQKVSRQTSKFVKAKNLGLKHARFYVLRNTLIPAILVEVGFLTNPKEERLLKTSQYRQKLAYGLAESILDYVEKR